jgi:hydrogenase expression/formation protein HypD
LTVTPQPEAFITIASTGARSSAILRGVKRPTDCKLFGTVCTPENPMGSCMVSSEGSCAAHYTYGRWRDIPVVAQ